MKYYAQFNEGGIRITTFVEGLHNDIPAEAILISEEEQALYAGGNYKRNMETGTPELIQRHPIILTPAEQREHAYETNPLIEWEGENVTVDQANIIFLRYFAEGDPKAEEIQTLIISAKESIRQMYQDEREE